MECVKPISAYLFAPLTTDILMTSLPGCRCIGPVPFQLTHQLNMGAYLHSIPYVDSCLLWVNNCLVSLCVHSIHLLFIPASISYSDGMRVNSFLWRGLWVCPRCKMTISIFDSNLKVKWVGTIESGNVYIQLVLSVGFWNRIWLTPPAGLKPTHNATAPYWLQQLEAAYQRSRNTFRLLQIAHKIIYILSVLLI